jgi:uncharacterized protein (DUF2236 family)
MVTTDWPAPLGPRELDRRYPGIIDGISVLAGGANVIMQLSWRGVGRGVIESTVESGQLFRHPLKRTRTTMTYLGVALVGTREEKLAYREAVNGAHRHVRSTAKSPVRYDAFDPELQLWVAACLVYGILDTRQRLRGELPRETLEEMYRYLAPLGTTLQVHPELWPADLAAFEAYWNHGLARIELDDEVRSYLLAFVSLKFLWRPLRFVFGPFNRLVTTGFLPEPVRLALGLSWTARQQRRFDRILRLIAFANRLLPRPIRQLPNTIVMWDFRRRLRRGAPLV